MAEDSSQSLHRLPRVTAIIPALNEEAAIGKVLAAVPAWANEVIVVDNGSTDRTADVARAAGARVIAESRRGYGSACLAGMAALTEPEVVVFLDADFSDRPEEMERLVAPIVLGGADLVIGSRSKGRRESGAMTIPQRFGNALACGLMRVIYRANHTDLGPFRAIRHSALRRLAMDDRGYGWTIQMQIRAARMGLRVAEVPVSYRRRVGRSKISGTLRGVVAAGTKILYTIFRESRRRTWLAPAERLVVFARHPTPGQTKTRLIPALGPHRAADLQREMTRHTLTHARALAQRRRVDLQVRFAGGDAHAMRSIYGEGFAFAPQGEGDLGQRLGRAAHEACAAGAGSVVVIGSDCPQLSTRLLDNAFTMLGHHDLVLGPASDGGYYLIGVRHCWPALFADIDWGTERVLAQTLAVAKRMSLSVAQLETLSDVDRPEDLHLWFKHAPQPPPKGIVISVIIPALDEERLVAAAIRSASVPGVEVIVVDGGSTDRTAAIAESLGARVLRSLAGRARQMNVGAGSAGGEVLLFLHADSTLPSNFATEVARTLLLPDTAAGAFRLAITPPDAANRVLAETTNFRSRCFQLPYGDQAIFLTRALFDRLGGFADIPIMEEIDFVERLKRLGQIRLTRETVTTSGRRWQRYGRIRTSAVNQLLLLGYHFGFAPWRLYRWRESVDAGKNAIL